MVDLQSEIVDHGQPIDKVGVKGLRYPITVMDKRNRRQTTVAEIDIHVSLPSHFRGTHMSRFIEIFDRYREEFSRKKLREMLNETKARLQAESAWITIAFPYFIMKSAPVTGLGSLMSYDCILTARLDLNDNFEQVIDVSVPVMNLCPCSKEISQYGAHNQRSHVTVRVASSKLVWIEDIVEVVESCASSPVYSLLKRQDEKYVTEHSYEQPRFVEDIVREIAMKLGAWPDLEYFSIDAENYESIHNHNAHAFLERRL